MNYIVYDRKTGNILRTGTCPPEMLEIQAASDNEEVMEGDAHDALDLVDLDTKEVRREGKMTRLAYVEMSRPVPVSAEERLIESKKNELLRSMAIDALKEEGKL